MLLGYNTNGMAHHDLLEAVDLLADLGYRSVAITIDHGALPPGGAHTERRVDELRGRLAEYGMRSVIEPGRPDHDPVFGKSALPDHERAWFTRQYVECLPSCPQDQGGVSTLGSNRRNAHAIRWISPTTWRIRTTQLTAAKAIGEKPLNAKAMAPNAAAVP